MKGQYQLRLHVPETKHLEVVLQHQGSYIIGRNPSSSEVYVRGDLPISSEKEDRRLDFLESFRSPQLLGIDPTVSTKHLQIDFYESTVFLTDLGSSNGTLYVPKQGNTVGSTPYHTQSLRLAGLGTHSLRLGRLPLDLTREIRIEVPNETSDEKPSQEIGFLGNLIRAFRGR